MFDRLELWKEQKQKLKLKYDDIAERSNIPKGTIQNIFAGYIDNPRIDTVQAIERALGLNKLEWTDEEKAQGVGSHSVKLSADEWEWLELRSELLEAGGQEYLDTITTLLQKSAEISKKKK